MSQVFEIDDINKSNVTINKSINEPIATKYIKGSNVYVVDANVNFSEKTGKMIYVRESYSKLNIYQTTYKIDEYENVASQVRGYMDTFEEMCKSYIGVDSDKEAYTSTLYENDTTSAPIPLEESIYYENRLYSLTYKVDDTIYLNDNSLAEKKENVNTITKEYDINFYRSGNNLVCELANVF